MRRSLTTAVVLVTVAGLAAVPSQAATRKKPKPITGSYTLTLPPDPTKEAGSVTGDPGCSGALPSSKDSHPFTLPAAGTLKVTLDVDDATGRDAVGVDWDLYLMEDGAEAASSDAGTGHETVLMKVRRKTTVTIDACNLTGQPTAKVAYTFTYK